MRRIVTIAQVKQHAELAMRQVRGRHSRQPMGCNVAHATPLHDCGIEISPATNSLKVRAASDTRDPLHPVKAKMDLEMDFFARVNGNRDDTIGDLEARVLRQLASDLSALSDAFRDAADERDARPTQSTE